MTTVRANQGDTLDQLVMRYYGSTSMTEAVLAANPGIAAHGPTLPMGTLVNLPTVKPAKKIGIRLW